MDWIGLKHYTMKTYDGAAVKLHVYLLPLCRSCPLHRIVWREVSGPAGNIKLFIQPMPTELA
jgi:hypothetical protein